MEAIPQHVTSCAQSAHFHSLAQAIDAQQVMQAAVAIQQIPAPTFDEQRRAEHVRDRFIAAGLRDVSIDALHNAGYAPDPENPCNWYGDVPVGWGHGRRMTELQGAIARVQLSKLDDILSAIT